MSETVFAFFPFGFWFLFTCAHRNPKKYYIFGSVVHNMHFYWRAIYTTPNCERGKHCKTALIIGLFRSYYVSTTLVSNLVCLAFCNSFFVRVFCFVSIFDFHIVSRQSKANRKILALKSLYFINMAVVKIKSKICIKLKTVTEPLLYILWTNPIGRRTEK